MQFTLEFFANDKYKLLKLLHENQVKVKDSFYVPMSQQEIADMAHFSKLKTNQILNELIAMGFVENYKNMRAKYRITDMGIKSLNLMQKNNG
jgi:predicted transcriptional regulator